MQNAQRIMEQGLDIRPPFFIVFLPASCMGSYSHSLANYMNFFLCFGRAAMSVIEYILFLRIASPVCLRELRNIEFYPCCREI